MNTRTIYLSAALLSSFLPAPGFAGENLITYDGSTFHEASQGSSTLAKSDLSRAQVRAEAAAANEAGNLSVGSWMPAARTPAKPAAPLLSRAEVRAEAAAANEAGRLSVGSWFPNATAAQTPSTSLAAASVRTMVRAGAAPASSEIQN